MLSLFSAFHTGTPEGPWLCHALPGQRHTGLFCLVASGALGSRVRVSPPSTLCGGQICSPGHVLGGWRQGAQPTVFLNWLLVGFPHCSPQ